LGGTLEHTLLEAVLGDEPEDVHLLRLSDTMSSVHSLKIGLWIPIIVVEYDNICRCQIDTEASNASCEQEDELLVTRLVVLVDPADMIIICGPTINAVVFILLEETIILSLSRKPGAYRG